MKITFNSPAILTFSFISAAVYILTGPLGLFKSAFILFPVWDFSHFEWYFRLFSNTVGHASSNHLMGNLALILLLGPIVEEKYGSKNMIFMILITAVVTSLIHISFSNSALLGASGIVFMLILLVSMANFKNNQIPLTFILIVIIYLGKEILGFFQDDNISHTTHIIGGLLGAVFGYLFSQMKIKKG
ncbi:rhomboid family intramembrane serine protease [Crocinitomix catalasitica]|uniref:rhomboid family intramembrane serine protease n=1 Tax=Crocinitomix catalasitica TaxID=184607 RepID=UPI000480D693|nr:rhomboid family intramembrane serine protease [Crocinitomix catalasitica]